MPRKSDVEAVNPYGEGEKTGQVEEMFDSIAPAYDFMNRCMSFGLCGWWRNRAMAMAMEFQPRAARIMDVATGTGDVAFELLKRYPEAEINGVDLSAGMLEVARRKARDIPGAERVAFRQGDSLALPYDDGTYDLVTIAYGVRNFAHLDRGLTEICRTLRPGGTICIIELSVPANAVMRAGYRLYSNCLIPLVGRWVSGDKSAYTYLPQSIAACPQRDDMTALMRQAGFDNCRWKSLTFGVVTIYIGKKRL